MEEVFRPWQKLDNAAHIFPSIVSVRVPAVFRLQVAMKGPVNARTLQAALDHTIARYDVYRVQFKGGFFWPYLESVDTRPKVEADYYPPCKTITLGRSQGLLFRVLAGGNRIAVEFSHILTDGFGGLQFLRSLLVEYLRLKGLPIVSWLDVIDPESEADPGEYEDAYIRYYDKSLPKPERLSTAFHLPYPTRKPYGYSVLSGTISARQVITRAKERGVSLTVYLCAVYLHALQGIVRVSRVPKKRRVVRVEIPVNLRRMFPSKTLKNFTLFITPGLDLRLGDYTFDETVKAVHHYMQMEVDPKPIGVKLARNVRGEQNPFVRAMPLVAKNWLLAILFHTLGYRFFSGVITNLGNVSLPPEVGSEVESFSFVPPPGRTTKVHCAVVTYQDSMVINFGNITDYTELERRFFSFLVQDGIDVQIRRFGDGGL